MNSTTSALSTVTLKAKRDQSIRRKHPWVFSGGIKHIQGAPQAGDWVKVCANKGAHWDGDTTPHKRASPCVC